MVFTSKPVKTQTLGEYLSACRERSGLSVSEVAMFSQVQPKYLLALEEGRLADLPAQVYVKGFLRSLAKIYKVNAEELLRQYLDEYQIADNLEIIKPVSAKVKFAFPRLIFNPKILALALVVLLGLLGLTYLYFQVSSLRRPPSLEVFSPAQDEVTNSSLLMVRGKTEGGAAVYLNNQMIVVDANGEFRENLSLAQGSNQLTIKAVNKFGQKKEITRSILLQEKALAGSYSGVTSTGEIVEGQGNFVLEIQIGDKTAWIYLEADGIEKYSGTMLAHSHQTFVARDKIVLTTGNAGSTRVVLNGRDLGILGKEGEVIRDIEFTR